MPLYLQQRQDSKIWRIRGSHHGVHIDQSSGTRSKAEARKILQKLEKDIFAEIHGFTDTKRGHYTFIQAAEDWLKAGGDAALYFYFDKIVTAIGDMPLKDFTQGFIDTKARELFPTQAPSTVNRGYYALVSVIYNHAVDNRNADPIRIRKQKVIKKRIDWHTPAEINQLLAAAGEMAPLITFYIGTGARTAEALKLEWRDVSPDNQRVTFWTTKGNKARSVDLCDRTRAAMPERGFEQVWRKANGKPWSMTKDGRFYGPKLKLTRICERAGLKPVTMHSLRHSWASWQYAVWPDAMRLKEVGGWSRLDMVMNYTHLGTQDLRREVLDHGWFQFKDGQNTGSRQAAIS